MLIASSAGHQTDLFGNGLLHSSIRMIRCYRLTSGILWQELDQDFAKH